MKTQWFKVVQIGPAKVFNWPFLAVAPVLMAVPLIEAGRGLVLRCSKLFATVNTGPKNPCNQP